MGKLSSTSTENFLSISILKISDPSPGILKINMRMLLVVESLEVISCIRPKLLLAALQGHGLWIIHQLLYIHYTVTYTENFPAFSDTTKSLLLTCIQDNAEGLASVKALDWCGNSLAKQLQKGGSGMGQACSLVTLTGKSRSYGSPGAISQQGP